MKSVSQKSRMILHHLAALAEANGGNVKIDNTDGRFMPVHVEHIGNNCMSVAHYGEQNGDAMRDPDMVFWKGADLGWYPVSFRNDYAGIYCEIVQEFENGQPKSYSPRDQADAVKFANLWLENILQQQELTRTRQAVPA